MSDFDIVYNAVSLIRTHCTYHHHWVANSLENRIAGWKKLESENADLKRQLGEAQEDAERYRWLKEIARLDDFALSAGDGPAYWKITIHAATPRDKTVPGFEKAIDAAITSTEPKSGVKDE